jgi:NAD(P)-dependent dehydrogenase (short-subunit alcohol dehydrogenase family)
MRSVVITGASTGIGEDCTLRMCALGWRVFAGVRRVEDGEALRAKVRGKGRGTVVPVLMDVTDVGSIESAVRQVEEMVGARGLQGLVNNAGIVVAAPLEFVPLEDFRRQLEVNVTGQLAVTQAFLPMLRKARGRIVNMGSVSGRVTTPMLGPYCVSKFGLDALSSGLRMELEPWGIRVAYIQPGAIATPFWRKALDDAEGMIEKLPASARELYDSLITPMLERAERSEKGGLPVGEVGKTVVHALVSSKPKTRYPIGGYARAVEVLRIVPDKLRERIILSQVRK